MNEEDRTEVQLNRFRAWLRDDYRRPFNSGLEWGWPRCRTEEERILYPLLLAALSPYTAVVAHRRLPEGCAASFAVHISRVTPDGVLRLHWNVLAGADTASLEEDGPTLYLDAADIRDEPWRAVAQLMSVIMERLLTIDA